MSGLLASAPAQHDAQQMKQVKFLLVQGSAFVSQPEETTAQQLTQITQQHMPG
jgi:hypothetical protein